MSVESIECDVCKCLQNYNHVRYSIIPELFLFWILLSAVLKKQLKNLETSTVNILHLLQYIDELYKVGNILSLFLF